MSTTIRITDLPDLSTVNANTLNTVFVVVDKSSGVFTTKQLSLARVDYSIVHDAVEQIAARCVEDLARHIDNLTTRLF